MTRFPSGLPCERARAWAALVPDGELSVLERKLLDAHLARCGACTHFSAQVAALVAQLRDASLHPLPGPVSIPARHPNRIYARARMVGAAAAVAAMALGVASRAPLSPGQHETLRFARVADFAEGDLAEQQALRDARREAIVAAIAARSRPAGHFGTQPI
jgi:predicted anti-sigma-YlaC factor YlaD